MPTFLLAGCVGVNFLRSNNVLRSRAWECRTLACGSPGEVIPGATRSVSLCRVGLRGIFLRIAFRFFSIIIGTVCFVLPLSPLFPVPTYDYRCEVCSHEFEEFQYIKDAPLKKCPKCKKNKLRRLIGGGAAVVFRGSGFYQTDYRSDSYRKAASAETTPKSEAASACKNCSAAGDCKAKN